MGSGEHQFITSQSEIQVSTWGLRLASECTQSREFEPFGSVRSLSCVWLFATPRTRHDRPPCPSPTPRVHPNPCPSMPSNHLILCCLLLLPPSTFPSIRGSFQMSQLFVSGGQSIGVSASTSVLPMNTQDWSPLGWTGWISLHSKGLLRVFSNTTVQKHQFFCA